MDSFFPAGARWIWHDGDRQAYHEYVRFRTEFEMPPASGAAPRRFGGTRLRITAGGSLYQAWLNGQVLGHGPAKAAEGRLAVDDLDPTLFLKPGKNRLDVLVLGLGGGSMTHCGGEAGLIFQLDLGDRTIASDSACEVQRDRTRSRRTVRRWMLPCLEDVDAAAPETEAEWHPATVVELRKILYPRPVPLPAREPLFPKRLVASQMVKFPNFSCSLLVKPYLVPATELRRNNLISQPAYLVTDVVSPVAQDMELVPTLGNVRWHADGREIIHGSGWTPWDPAGNSPVLHLRQGANRLVAVHEQSHFEDISLCAFVTKPVRLVNPLGAGAFQVIPAKRVPRSRRVDPSVPTSASSSAEGNDGETPTALDWEAAAGAGLPPMDPTHTMPEANAQDLVMNARPLHDLPVDGWPDALVLNGSASVDEAHRIILDLGVLHNGWLAFEVTGPAGARLIFSFFEAMEERPGLRIQWPAGCNNALTYRLREGRQEFESFLPYGVRYIAVHYTGPQPARLQNLRLLTANCGSRRQGFLHSSDLLLNGIYEIAAQAVISATDDTYTDCPTFEQVNWNFDNRMSFLTDMLTCANTAVARNSLRLFAQDPRFPGLVRSQYPSAWDSRIPMFSFHWIMFCRDYYRQTGDIAFVEELFPRIAAGIAEALGMINRDGLLEWPCSPEAWHFVDWGHGRDDNHAVVSAEQAGLAGALAAAAELADVLGRPMPAWHRARLKLIRAVRRHLWDGRREAFRDSLHEDGTPSPACSQSSNAALALYGVGDRAWARRLVRRILAGDRRLLPYGSPAGSYYVLELLDHFGEADALFRIIRQRWGDMVRAGDTSTWEHFAEFGHAGWPTRSRCHPFASYVSKYLVKYLLGIQSLAPGYACVRIRPRPPRGVTRCRGAIPTPHGPLRVAWERVKGRIEWQAGCPAGVRLEPRRHGSLNSTIGHECS